MLKATIVATFLFLILVLSQNEVQSSPTSDMVNKWAENFGTELWDLAQRMTKSKEIRSRYKTSYAKVQPKNGTILIADIVASIGRMLNRKMDAVKCIVNKSEDYAEAFHRSNSMREDFQYYSSKYSLVNNFTLTDREYTTYEENSTDKYREMTFEPDTHFFNLEVNTTHSSVHVPTNVYDEGPEEWEFIQWSEILDEVFTQNYQSDPALSWQYFGSNLGIMRNFPAMSWDRNKTDTFDCRKRSWYIETATCSKDVVILLDNSGSMTGFRSYVARYTIKSLLGTFSNNDFINILSYSKTTDDSIIPCFKDILVQATPDNINAFNEATKLLIPEGYANVTVALEKAFKLLEKYRDIRKCNESKSGCNQAIMLVTDGVPGNATEVFQKYNEYGNANKSSPVRVFTYLLGKEVTKVKEIQLYACLNRGYYSHIQTLDEVAQESMKYVNVIAAPLVLQKEDHPPTWTHAYIGEANQTDSDKAKVDKTKTSRLMIAVGVPAYNQSSYGEGNYTGRPKLLGVAGTDIPLEDIDRMALPYKLGVNGYTFIISNNGYVLLHPDLRPIDPLYPDRVKENYNSMDLTEVEQFMDDTSPRLPCDKLLELRHAMVDHKSGKIVGVPVRFHYDSMRRAANSTQDFYFAPIPHTPFSLGIALPSVYGNTWIKVGNEIERNTYTKINISDFFVGENWKVHPDWIYCRYHYLEGHEEIMKTSEDELRHFLKKIVEKDWEWSEQYEKDEENDREKETDELNCGRKTLNSEAYYCNKELVQMVVFDAKVTNDSYQSWSFRDDLEREIIERYNATVRFVSTMSGLTRWQFIFGEVEVDFDTEFGDLYSTSLNEPWYKSAVLQHGIEENSFVYSVPHYDDRKSENSSESDIKVTASMAIFPRDGGQEAPSCVVGFQFSHELMYERFMELTSTLVDCKNCIKSCGSDEQDCYVIDNNGYVLISEANMSNTGRFFGELEGSIMEVMVNKGVFNRITVYDYQGLCKNETRGNETNLEGGSIGLISPFKLLLLGLKWMLTEMIIELSRIGMWVQSSVIHTDYSDQEYEYEDFGMTQKTVQKVPTNQKGKGKSAEAQEAEDYFRAKQEKLAAQVVTVFYACDRKADLYDINEVWVRKNGSFSLNDPEDGVRSFHVSRIPHSNLLLVVIDQMRGNSISKDLTTKMDEVNTWWVYNATYPCYKIYMNNLSRRRLDECFTEHAEEEAMSYCGSVARIKSTMLLQLLAIMLPMLFIRLLRLK